MPTVTDWKAPQDFGRPEVHGPIHIVLGSHRFSSLLHASLNGPARHLTAIGQDPHREIPLGDAAQPTVCDDQDGAPVFVPHPDGHLVRRRVGATVSGSAVITSWTCWAIGILLVVGVRRTGLGRRCPPAGTAQLGRAVCAPLARMGAARAPPGPTKKTTAPRPGAESGPPSARVPSWDEQNHAVTH